MSNAVHVYVSQAHKGELVMGAGIDAYNGYGQRGAFHIIERQMAAARRAVPGLRPGARAADLGRASSTSPRTPRRSSGSPPSTTCTSTAAGAPAGSRPRPASAGASPHTIATGEPHPLNAPFALDRFTTGALVDEHGAAAVAH